MSEMSSADGHVVSARGRGGAILRLILAGGVIFLCACPQDESGRSGHSARRMEDRVLTVAAAANVRFALDAMLDHLHRANPGIRVVVSYGASGILYSQIVHGAPFDIFLSADLESPRRLVEAGHAEPASEFVYARGFLVMWVPTSSALDPAKEQWDTFRRPTVRKIAIANPAHAPYGRAAEAAMKSAGVYEIVRDRLVLAENIAQAAQFVDSGAADVGLIALSLALAPPMRDRGRFWEIPADRYARLEQGGVILTRTREPLAAQALREFLVGNDGQAILKRFGFSAPGA